MIFIESGKKNAGLRLLGHYDDMRVFHDLIHRVTENSRMVKNKGVTMGLAYDVRHAYQGDRILFDNNDPDYPMTYCGFEAYWPTFLLQITLIRTAISYQACTKEEQGLMFIIEGLIEDAIQHSFDKPDVVLSNLKRLSGFEEKMFPEDVWGSRMGYFMSLTAKERAKQLHKILFSFDPMYEATFRIFSKYKSDKFISPESFENYSWDTLEYLSEAKLAI